ncbi:MAG: tRNA preQ1(34) S-adenosylmethionine ribosyltransferase-isomerase QueA [Planctomycetaceae bacterium]|jgi:S-adenosylmethionine:tRNA ribosyltransferase-isomerase|nr:tRNA preQ1(34) S-adenosylmethionine ribosyltransferase-isomerase QueA [Planctomycetaceae bacterium]
MSVKNLSDIFCYDYVLPPELIAQQPLPDRTDARLLAVNRQTQSFEHLHIRDLPSLLKTEDVLVINDTKVLPARLFGRRAETGGKWEGLFIEAVRPDLWKILCKTRGRMKPDEKVVLQTQDNQPLMGGVHLLFVAQQNEYWLVRPVPKISYFELLQKHGFVPLPPYIRKGKMMPEDAERYQTVYASQPGAIAAPTAGLHFTPELLEEIKKLGTAVVPVTLHVGAGTFKPITAGNVEEHTMHAEWCSMTEANVSAVLSRRKNGGRIVAVGTTSVRVLESASAAAGTLQQFEGDTSLFIRPPYSFKSVDVLLTNFHFPKSTLLILVRTFGGDELIKAAYEEAVRKRYRFFSYGDAMLIY